MNDVEAAKKRVQEYIARSAGQHLRAMRAKRESYIDGVSEYDADESQAEEAANRQIEHDQQEQKNGN